jgi:hypothetical protein
MELKHMNESNSVNEIATNMKEELKNVKFLVGKLMDSGTFEQTPIIEMLHRQIDQLNYETDILANK